MLIPAKRDEFIAASAYRAPVDRKKLGFIFDALEHYCTERRKDPADLRVLEVGCGTGGITVPLARLGCRITALDVDEPAVRNLQSSLADFDGRVRVQVANGYTFDGGERYDLVIASEVFEHVLDPLRLARNLQRQMTPGAFLLVTTPNGYGPFELKNKVSPYTYLFRSNIVRRWLGKPPYVYGSGVDHCQFYTRGRLLKLFGGLNFSLLKFGKSDSVFAVFAPLRNSHAFGALDIRLADALPHWAASGWYFLFQSDGGSDRRLAVKLGGRGT